MAGASARARGFTLIEVMVALTILSLVLLGTMSGLRTLGNTQLALERTTARVDEVRTVSGLLRHLFDTAIVGSDVDGLTLGGGAMESTYFRVEEGAVEWKTNLLFGESYGGIYVVRIAAEADGLTLRWLEPEATQLDSSKWEAAPSRVLVTELEEFQVAVREEFQDDWNSDWPDSSTAPALVRLQVKAAGRYWPEIVMQARR